jgi:hypothetical protein
MAHLIELPHKIGLPDEQYLVVQQIYRGWSLAAIVVIGALLSTAALAVVSRRQRAQLALALIAFLSLVATQVVFWLFTFPANQATQNWTQLPEGWAALRQQWEYSHAASAVLDLAALLAVIASVVSTRYGEGRAGAHNGHPLRKCTLSIELSRRFRIRRKVGGGKEKDHTLMVRGLTRVRRCRPCERPEE